MNQPNHVPRCAGPCRQGRDDCACACEPAERMGRLKPWERLLLSPGVDFCIAVALVACFGAAFLVWAIKP